MVGRIPRRTPKEFAFVLRNDGRTHLLVVEGFSDRAFFRWALNWLPESPIAIHAVEEIQIPREWLPDADHYSNNRALVAAVCIARGSGLGFPGINLRGVIDRDCGIPDEWAAVDCLLATDAPAIESYCFTAATLQKWLLLTLHDGDLMDGQALIEELTPILAGLFAVRSKVGTLGVPVSKILEFKDGQWVSTFRHQPGLTAIYEAGGATALETDGLDPRCICYGHDLAEVLMIRFAGKVKNQAGLKTAEHFERSLIAHLEMATMKSEPLHLALEAWMLAPA